MNILGISGTVSHDAAAALICNGQLIAAAEEERFTRNKHAKECFPYEAVKWCLQFAGLKPTDIDFIAMPYAAISLHSPGRWHYAKRHWYAPDRALVALLNGNRRYKKNIAKAKQMMSILGFSESRTQLIPVEHHLAHASSAYHLSGFTEKTAILGIDGKGEYATTFFGYGENGKIHKIKEFYDPDSLGGVYGAITQYLGFEMLDGEFKVMGMAPYGDPDKFDLSSLIHFNENSFKVNTKLINTVGLRRYKQNNQAYFFSKHLVDWLGPKRQGDEIDEPYIHYAASMQKLLETISLKLINYYLGDTLKQTGKLCFAGGVALNVKLNQRILESGLVKELFVQPAANDAGTALGAASFVAAMHNEQVKKLPHVYLGPQFTTQECIAACQSHPAKPIWQLLADPVGQAADILAQGHPLAWFQGRMEFGPRALGNRSILGNPAYPKIADKINMQIKYRERWRPFCPSMLDKVAYEILQTNHPAPYMTFTFKVAEHWKSRIPEVVHEDGTARAQVVSEETNPRYYALLKAMENRTGYGVLLNTSLNRRGEPMVCSPSDALDMFFGSDLKFLIMEDVLVVKADS